MKPIQDCYAFKLHFSSLIFKLKQFKIQHMSFKEKSTLSMLINSLMKKKTKKFIEATSKALLLEYLWIMCA